MLAVTGTTGKLGGAVLEALLSYDLVPTDRLVVLSSSALDAPKVKKLLDKGIIVRQANYADTDSVRTALRDCTALFLVSTPEVHLDFNDAPSGQGRESRHISAIQAAVKAGVTRVVYSSLAFKDGSQAGVMRAHFRTEQYLVGLAAAEKLESYVILREGLYSESWPLYLGHFNLAGEDRHKILVAGDGQISWTSIADIGLANALILTAPPRSYHNQTLFLSARKTLSLAQVAKLVQCSVKEVSAQEYVSYYHDNYEMDPAFLEWWVSTYPSLASGLCNIEDNLLEELLQTKGRTPESFESILKTMLLSGR